eukprot:3183097-Amphidinium_carterae.1
MSSSGDATAVSCSRSSSSGSSFPSAADGDQLVELWTVCPSSSGSTGSACAPGSSRSSTSCRIVSCGLPCCAVFKDTCTQCLLRRVDRSQ